MATIAPFQLPLGLETSLAARQRKKGGGFDVVDLAQGGGSKPVEG